jgi:hypothetical protein
VYFVGQWLDVKDTVSQWLEATVMEVDAAGRRVYVHYNGWPVRWDEWLDFASPRLAPFRTRTLHALAAPAPTQQQQQGPVIGVLTSPAPTVYVTGAPPCQLPRSLLTSPSGGAVDARNHDDARVMLVAVASMARTLMPLLQEAADLSALALRDDDEQEREQGEQQGQPGGSGDSRRHGEADMAPGEAVASDDAEVAAVAEAGAEDAQRRRAQHRRRLQRAAEDLCPTYACL